jgi:deoxyribonuclease V
VSGVALRDWPRTGAELAAAQAWLGGERPDAWGWDGGPLRVAGCAVVAARGAAPGGDEIGFAAAALVDLGAGAPRVLTHSEVAGPLRAGFASGLLALREGPLLAAAIAALPGRPGLLMVHAAGRDHPRGAGLAVMLGAILEVPSIGVTQRPLAAEGAPPEDRAGARSPLARGGEEVACWVRTRSGARPIVAHAAWRTTPELAARIVLAATAGTRFPEPLRRALERARALRDRRFR